jgi:hypothetical protein
LAAARASRYDEQPRRSGRAAEVRAGDLLLVDEVRSGRGYQSHFGNRLQFGLDRHGHVDRIEVRWPTGGTDMLESIRADQLFTITEGGLLGDR